MQRKARGVKLDGSIYDHLFEPATGKNYVVKKRATLSDTLHLFPDYVPRYAYQAEKLAAELRDPGGDLYKTCYNIWYFLVNYIAYEPDQPGIEQIRSPYRLWSDKIGDCDCFAFTCCCLMHVMQHNCTLRITAYTEKDNFQHIYVVVPHQGKEIIIDACLEKFNIEVPYINKTEVEMDLQFLNGLDPEVIARNGGSIDAQDLLQHDLGSIKSFFQKAGTAVKNAATNVKQDVKKVAVKTKDAVKKSIHVINRVNPVTTATRVGLLAAMKENMFGIAEKLRYAYLSDTEAIKRRLNMKRHARYKGLVDKVSKIFFAAGGQPENLKTAILTGKGNKDKDVALAGYPLRGVTSNSTLQEILGDEMYRSEIPSQVNGLGSLGLVVATTVAAASGILATIAAIIKNIGDIKKDGDPGPDADADALQNSANQNADDTAAANTPDEADPNNWPDGMKPGANERDASTGTDSTSDGGGQAPADSPPPGSGGNDPAKTDGSTLSDFYEKYKTPIWIVGGAVVATGGFFGVRAIVRSMKKKSAKKNAAGGKEVNGIPRRRKGKKFNHAGNKLVRQLKMKPFK